MKKNLHLLACCLIAAGFCTTLQAQSVENLIQYYSGKATWDNTKKTLTFEESGTIRFPNRSTGKDTYWNIPGEVEVIVINKFITVTAQFVADNVGDITIKGLDRKTSRVFGTDAQDYLGMGGGEFITFLATGRTNMTVRSLTSLNPKGWHSRSENAQGADMKLFDCDFIDNRGGFGNNSDGNHNASLIQNCYFETGDDVICNYGDINQTVIDCRIKLVQNAIPIQYGYEGPTSGNTTLTIKNLVVEGNIGRNGASFVQCINRTNSSKKAVKTLNIDGLVFKPSNNNTVGYLFLADDNVSFKGTWKNVDIKVKAYYNDVSTRDAITGNAKSDISICGTTVKKNTYSCGIAPARVGTDALVAKQAGIVFPNPASDAFTIQLSAPQSIAEIKLYDQTGKMLYRLDPATVSENKLTFGKELRSGLYLLRITQNDQTNVIKLVKQ